MLQINTGKLFTRGVGHTNHLRGVLYTNGSMQFDDIVTAAGSLRATGGAHGNRAIVYEIEEHLERAEPEPGVIVSHLVNPYLRDFATVASFGLDLLFSTDADVVDRLTTQKGTFSSYDPPRAFVARIFDEQVLITEEDRAALTAFVDELLALERRSFLAAMHAMRSYVAGLHRIADDLGLAYTLLVSAVESLSQEFDDHQPTWADIDHHLRASVDVALQGVPAENSEAVRRAITEREHTALRRRYQEFAWSKIDASYFREGAPSSGRAVGRRELREALKQAYSIRSGYVHRLTELPDALAIPHNHWEVTEVDRRPALTLHGLTRLTRHVIRAFVAYGPKCDREAYNYTFELAGVVRAPLAPQYWIAQPLLEARAASRRLEGFLEQLANIDLGRPGAALSDLRPVLADVERLLPQSKGEFRPTLYALHVLFNCAAPAAYRSVSWEEFHRQNADLALKPRGEVAILRAILGCNNWPLDLHRNAYLAYWAARWTPSGLHAPRLYEAAMALTLAERYREEGDVGEARRLIEEAADNYPGGHGVLDLQIAFDPSQPIQWRQHLLPPPDPS